MSTTAGTISAILIMILIVISVGICSIVGGIWWLNKRYSDKEEEEDEETLHSNNRLKNKKKKKATYMFDGDSVVDDVDLGELTVKTRVERWEEGKYQNTKVGFETK